MVQFKAKTPNNIFLIPTLAFIPYLTNPNVLVTSLNFIKNPDVLDFPYQEFALMIKIKIMIL